ncbi:MULTISPECIES: type 4a pilus biogenesis protein PilO [Oleiagrimonas]|jgi:type IV pilus assembly protein PilO|uniref:Type 4a pilus biogenesis protein PilO n=1 Tax=Oleiagrimonas citrea TaxID=1665687 RepID=A0A846ZN58_9GAMM|nr:MULTISPECIES: type 4a pilus biogenesis protein PilO [Oleiagrimonas]NKZ39406.1 type 4a pilus biogenesis protein PilO [Oleiagrimonas citrea]RAP59611.1 fimbrial protein [Oleiagrimonas sp. MCCC 1A03011]
MSFFDELRNLDTNNVGGWPKSVKTFFIVILLVVIVAVGWYFYTSNQQDELASLQRKEHTLRSEFMSKQSKAVNLEALRKQLSDMQDMLRQMLRQLPSKTEMPALLVDISQTALASGLQTETFAPGPESKKDFYAEKPIQLKMTGTYHQFGTFISGVASLPRVVILTMHNVSLKAEKAGPGGVATNGRLTLEGTVKTYRYLDDEDDQTGAGHPGGRGK